MKDYFEFCRKNKNAILFLQNATDDYIAARVSFLNGLVTPGYISAQQAVEKIIKSYILLLSPQEVFLSKKYPRHDLQTLLDRLSQLAAENFNDLSPYCFILSKVYHCMR